MQPPSIDLNLEPGLMPSSLLLRREDLVNPLPGFSVSGAARSKGDFALRLVTEFLRQTGQKPPAPIQNSTVSVGNLLNQHQQFQTLLEEVNTFFDSELMFAVEDQPLNEMVLAFAGFRVSEATRNYYAGSLKADFSGQESLLKARVIQTQQEMNQLLGL
ncbi:MAG: hypothetical protein K2X01_00190 [Cyanobacteria bacterium]|nr:hypothetical protein [Cyanobacteriota bacterium]